MSSNTVAGDRRWATARRGGMTVLGKVSVPKPLNLPSQRLENHGLDPNVEIVPKGTLSWGSRSLSSGSNAWVSSSLSPNADGGNTSPSHLSGHPSSGGSGTRPSTAGSDRTHEPVTRVWGSNSRPSSASGTVVSNQSSSTSLRPRSAETRPNSSQLSRFAEPVSESSAVWGPSSTAERLGIKSSKDDGFSLSSGDFPTLGSEKDQAAKNSELQDRSRPSSASGRIPQIREKDMKLHSDEVRGTANTRRADGSRGVEDGIYPSTEKWQGEPPQYFNANAPPQHFDAWRGPPMNAPGGVWYRGHPRGPSFGAPVTPGGFPMEPFPYYHRIPPPALAGSQPLPPTGSGLRGPHPKNGELYRPQMPDAYSRPGVLFRPGFYPGPPGPMAFDGYYGPPMAYCNNERDIPYVGMGAGPPVYNGYPNPVAPDIGKSHGRTGGRGTACKIMSEQFEPDHQEDTQGPKRAPLKKHHNDWDQKRENWEDDVHPQVSNPGKSCLPLIAPRTNEWGAEEDVEEDIFAKRLTPNGNAPSNFDFRGHSSDGFKQKSDEGTGHARTVNENWKNKSESMAAFPPQMTHPSHANDADPSLNPAPKDPALMQKIEGLNVKFSASDGRNDTLKVYGKKEERNKVPGVDLNFAIAVSSAVGSSLERTPASRDHVPPSHQVMDSAVDKTIQQVAVVSRTSYHGELGRVDYRGKGKFNSQDGVAHRRRHLPTEHSSAISNIELPPIVPVQEPNIVGEAGVNPIITSTAKMEGDSFAEPYDSADVQAQRAKMKELAKQRALQLQKEEEDRTREQKAKALAKLEELNRRTQAGEVAIQKAEGIQGSGVVQDGQEDSPPLVEPERVDPIVDSNLVPKHDSMERGSDMSQAESSVEESTNLPLDTSQTGPVEHNVPETHSMPLKDVHDATAISVAPQLSDGGISKHKRTGYKHKQNNSLHKSLSEKSVSNIATEAQKDHNRAGPNDMALVEEPSSETKPVGDSSVSKASNSASESSFTHRRKKSNRNKTKHKPDEVPTIPQVTSDIFPEKAPVEGNDSKVSLSNLDGAVPIIEPQRQVQTVEACSSVPNEEVPSRLSNQGKTQSSRRQLRTQQASRFTDKNNGSDTVMWAPVRTHNKAGTAIEASKKSSIELSSCSAKSDTVAQNSSKSKRAEMERYVPKPVAKELAQQGSIPSLSSSVSSSRLDEPKEQSGTGSSGSPQPVISTTTFVASNSEIEGDSRHNKHKKEHGTWRQRASMDSSHMKGVQIGPPQVSEPSGNIQQEVEQNQSVKSETNSAYAITFGSMDITASTMFNNTTTAGSKAVVKDHGGTGRAKGHHPRSSRIGDNPGHENIMGGETEASSVRSATPYGDLTRTTAASKENRTSEERSSSHWQPKSHSNSANSHHGNRTVGTETATTEINKPSKKEHPQHMVQVPPQHDKEVVNVDQPRRNQSASNTSVAEESVVGQHFIREKKPAPAKGRPYSPNQDLAGPESYVASNTDSQHELNISSGTRRSGTHNSHALRGCEPRDDWSSGHDNRPHNAPAFRGRQRQTMHYEYQPIGAKASNPVRLEEPTDGNNVGPRYREKGQNHLKRGGNYYRRQSGAVQVDSGQE